MPTRPLAVTWMEGVNACSRRRRVGFLGVRLTCTGFDHVLPLCLDIVKAMAGRPALLKLDSCQTA